jgi:acyl-CoA synthetase (AMP-forming)/AMP-acid ligase II
MRDQGIGTWPARRARMTPGRTALLHQGEPTTYAELARRTTKLASRLIAAGVAPGDRVAYLGPNHPAFVETLFATALAGATFVPLNFRLTARELEYQLADSAPALLVRAPEYAAAVPTPGMPVVELGPAYEAWLAEGAPEPVDRPVAADDIALILYTSGTTGRPKGAMLSHANLIWNTVNLLAGVDVRSDEVTLVSAPLFHIAALAQTLLPTLLKGGCDLIEKYRVTWMFGVTTMYAALAASPRWDSADLSSLRSLMCGGAAVPEALIHTYQQRGLVFCQGYGLTETAPGVTFLEASESTRHVGSAGVPVFFTDVRLAPAGASGAGEILVKGPNVTPGYWRNPEATAAAFTDDGWLRTGDLAEASADGHFRIVGRLKDMFISGGENVYPAEVENTLFEHPAVAEAAVIGVPDEKWGEVGHAFVVPHPGARVTPGELREFLRTRLAKYKVPVQFTFPGRLPRTGSGKIRKTALRSMAGDPDRNHTGD